MEGLSFVEKTFKQVKNKAHLTFEGLETIKQLKAFLSSVKI